MKPRLLGFKITYSLIRFYNKDNKFVSQKCMFQFAAGHADYLIFKKISL